MYTYDSKYQTVKSNEEKHGGYKHTLKKTQTYIYDHEEHSCLGASLLRWGKFLLMFLLICIFLLASFVGMFFIFTERIINEDYSYRNGGQSILNNAPSLSLRPIVDFKTALIRYRENDPSTYMLYVQSIRALVETYEDPDLITEESYATCLDGKKTPDDVMKPCKFNVGLLDMCRKQYNFGYDRSRPCIILKLNKIYGWVPNIYNSSMTKDVLIECHGQNVEDVENFGGVNYYPNVTIANKTLGYFSNLYYPYLVQYGYRQPLVGIEFIAPKRNVILMVECNTVNLIPKPSRLTFEILVD